MLHHLMKQLGAEVDKMLHQLMWNLLLDQWFLTGVAPPQGGFKKFPGGREPSSALKHGKFDQ